MKNKFSYWTKALQNIPEQYIQSIFFRNVSREYENDLLSASISYEQGGRYNKPFSYGVIYLADSAKASIEETYIPGFKMIPRILACVDVSLSSVIDLGNENILKELGIKYDQLFEPWRTNSNSLTHILGKYIYDTKKFEAIRFPSVRSRNPQAYNLAVFPDRLEKSSFLEIHDPSGFLTQRISGK